MFKNFGLVAVAVAGLSAAPASAAAYLNITQNPLEAPCVLGSSSCSFNVVGGSTAGTFTASANVTLPDLGYSTSALTTSLILANGGLSFNWITLTDPNGGIHSFSQDLNTPNTYSIELPVIAGQYTLAVNSTAAKTSSYGGDLTFAAVPEPATWALMILGFGAVGFTMRRRSSAARSVKASLTFA